MINQLLGNEADKLKEIKTSVLKLRGKTLIFENSIYQIPNISSLELVDLSSVKPMPKYFLWLLLVGVVLLFLPHSGMKILGLVILGVLTWLFDQYQQAKNTTRYGLSIQLNSGENPVLVSPDVEFLKRIMLVFYNIMNSDELKAFNFNFDQRQIDNKSIHVGTMNGSNLISGTVTGNVVSNV
ncbi:DUF6232 family protein [Kamptonema cortianum]|uniref:DUF6232 family protein n=1 Tax=Geitlerinema calcuttense NRMC-F 0142 TaxID=2922238 RepID=A0ABT7LXQ6_9CYAN|nr:DUF6232 family protein [Geitlerinema calcuttense]MDK3155458.1 DUF6232 family protein [Kamptonema cortianum]MDL5056796.1 DUF6232 family protein [Geitlerinema calcuttense NRMC-F 0142]